MSVAMPFRAMATRVAAVTWTPVERALAQGGKATKGATFGYQRDPPAGSVKCRDRVTVRAGSRCGRPAVVVAGCNVTAGRGGPRQTICQ
jgi:hypothetical protein